MKTDSKLKLLVSAMVILAFTVPILFWFILNPETFWEKLAMLIVHVIISISLIAVACGMLINIIWK